MDKCIKVRFLATQGAEDLFVTVDKPRRVYARQLSNVGDIVYWCSTTKWKGGYEADCPIGPGVAFSVVDKDDRVIFEEIMEYDAWNSGTRAIKKGPFYSEALKTLSAEFEKEHDLKPYKAWRDVMVADKDKYGYSGYRDNWMYCEAESVDKRILDEANVFGQKCFYIEEHMRHKISGREWMEYSLVDEKEETVLALCGYEVDNVQPLMIYKKESLSDKIADAKSKSNEGLAGLNHSKLRESEIR